MSLGFPESVVNIAHNARNIVRALANGAIIFIREADRAEAETWSDQRSRASFQPAKIQTMFKSTAFMAAESAGTSAKGWRCLLDR
jgi:hypothetical protein